MKTHLTVWFPRGRRQRRGRGGGLGVRQRQSLPRPGGAGQARESGWQSAAQQTTAGISEQPHSLPAKGPAAVQPGAAAGKG